MTLSRADIRAIAVAVADELERRAVANGNHSRRGSPIGIGARDQGDLECDEKERNEYMDPTIEEAERSDGESSSAELTAAKMLSVSRARAKHRPLRMPRAGKPKAAP